MKNLNPADFLTEAEKDQLSKDGFEITEQCQQIEQGNQFALALSMLAAQLLPDGSKLDVNIILSGQVSSIDIKFPSEDE